MRKQSAEIDPLLEPLLVAAGSQQVDEFLSQLIATHAEPVIKKIIHYKLHLNSHHTGGQADASDIHQEVIVQLLTALQQLRERPDAFPVGDLRGLAAVITHRTCSRWMRQQFPERHAFKNRLYYLLTRQRSFAVWQNENKKLIAGFSSWQGEKNRAPEKRLEQLSDDEKLIARIRLLKSGRQADWSGTLSAIFDCLGGPVEFDKLVAALVGLLQIRDQPIESTDQIENESGFEPPDGKPDAAWQVEKRIFLQRLWEEVRELPRNQRLALLLNLRDSEGKGCIALFPVVGVATLRQLAEALEISVEMLAGMWNDLPLEDTKIAELLQLTRQQIINARKSARERLMRRLRGFI